jgi:hypothetical protein
MAQQPGARCAIGVSNGNRAHIYIQTFIRDSQAVATIQHLNRESFVELPQPHILQFDAGSLQKARHGENGADSHFIGVTSRHGEPAECAQRLDILRYAIAVSAIPALWGAVHFMWGAHYLRDELPQDSTRPPSYTPASSV